MTAVAPTKYPPEPPPAYQPQGQGNPPPGQGQAYPPQGQGQAYPPQGQGQAYPPQGQGQAYPPPGQGQGYPPPGQGQVYPPQNQGQGYAPPPTTVVVQQPMVVGATRYGPNPVLVRCPFCSHTVTTTTSYETGTFPWLICLVVCLVGCYLGCCLIPFCVNGCKDVTHTCPNCRNQLGRFNRM